jgi:hypothetical protein
VRIAAGHLGGALNMDLSRRETLLRFLFGAGGIGLRALATGLPATLLLNPRKAFANGTCPQPAKAQYIIFNSSGGGDPINASSPGTYADPAIVHSQALGQTNITMRGTSYVAGAPWGTLPQTVLDRMQFWHIMTNTPVHAKEPAVLELMGSSPANEMFPSLLAQTLAPCLNTLQSTPVSLGGPPISYNGQALPQIPPAALKNTLGSPTGPLTKLQTIRDQTMNQLYTFYKSGATPAQQQYIDSMVTSQTQLRGISQSLMSALSSINTNTPDTQMLAAVTLIQMNVSPVMTVQIPFGGDNHSDANLATETAQTQSGVATIAGLMSQLQTAGLQDKVTFLSLNVFGRTLLINGNTSASNGRNHNDKHQVSLAIGKPFLGGVIGGVTRVGGDYGCTGIQSTTGASSMSGDITQLDTLGAFAQTMLAGVGGDPTLIKTGKVVTSALG